MQEQENAGRKQQHSRSKPCSRFINSTTDSGDFEYTRNNSPDDDRLYEEDTVAREQETNQAQDGEKKPALCKCRSKTRPQAHNEESKPQPDALSVAAGFPCPSPRFHGKAPEDASKTTKDHATAPTMPSYPLLHWDPNVVVRGTKIRVRVRTHEHVWSPPKSEIK